MAAPQYKAVGSASGVDGADPTPGYPTVANGDLLIAFCYVHSSPVSFNDPSGWTKIVDHQPGGSGFSYAWAHKSDGTETGTLTLDWIEDTATNLAVATISSFTGWNDTGNLLDAFEGQTNATGSSVTDAAASCTTLGSDRLLVALRRFGAAIASSVDAYAPNAWNHRWEFQTATANNGTIALDTLAVPSASTTSGDTDTITSTSWGNTVFAILPPQAVVDTQIHIPMSFTGGRW